jgi:hypothetical protein
LTADSFKVGIPVRLRADTFITQRIVARETLLRAASRRPAIVQFSRVAYSTNHERALVFAVRRCQERESGEAENGAYDTALLVPLEWRGAAWVALPPVYMDVY